jgi:osomolarity two-component system sensor histidine kinase SLN1
MRRLTSSRASTSKDVLDDAERGSTPLPMQHLHTLPSPREDNSSPEPPDDDLSPDASPPPLPPPALQSGGSARRGRKSARIDGGGRRLHVHWARFKKRLGTGTAPSTSEVTGSVVTGGSSVFLPRPSGMFERKERGAADDEKGGVDEVVVDRSWFDEIKSSVVSHSEADPTAREGAASRAGANGFAGAGTDQESVALHAEGFWALNTALVVLRYRFWPAVLDFFMLRFVDNESEDRYRKETWFLQKSLALWSAVFLITNWVRAR